nr:putative mitochondrial protein [Tanacetum cinerariifolium]
MAPNTRSVVGLIPNSSQACTNDSNFVDDNVRQLLGELVDERMSGLEMALEGLSGENVLGWVFRCEHFFNLDQETDEEKNLKYETSAKEYEDAFDDLLSRVEINEDHAIGLFMGGLPTEIAMGKNKTSFNGGILGKYNSGNNVTAQKSLLPVPNTPVITKSNTQLGGSGRRLSQKEYAEKRAQNLCFYCDQKYVPGHKCSCQLYSLIVLPEEEMKIEEFLDVDESIKDLDSTDLPTPRISLNALTALRGTQKINVEWMGTKAADKALKQVAHAEFHYMALCMIPQGDAYCMQMEGSTTVIDPKIQEVLAAYEDVFAVPTTLPPSRKHDHRIPLIEGAIPVNIRPYKHPPAQKDAIENYRQLNKQTVKDKFPIPIIKMLIDELHEAHVFTKQDLRSGYHQISMHEGDIAKTALRTHERHYEFLVMPFGLTNAPSTFKSLMNEVYRPYLRKFTLVFFDDVLIYSQSKEDHVLHVETVLETMRQHKLYAKKSKSMENWPILVNIKQLRGFLGLAGYYRRITNGFRAIEARVTTQVLRMPDFSKEFTIETDASRVGLGTVLLQDGHPIAFLSKTLSSKHQLMSTYEKVFLAIVQALEKWRGYLLDTHFKMPF